MKQLSFDKLFQGDKKLKIVMIIGIVGIILIGITTFIPEKSSPENSTEIKQTMDEYRTKAQDEVLELISSIEGVGVARVMITYKNGVEYVYAREEKQNTDKSGGVGADDVIQRDNYESKTIMVEDENGRKTALVRTMLEPAVKGVVIVCEGGDDIFVQQKVIEAVKIAMGIGANQVCVTK